MAEIRMSAAQVRQFIEFIEDTRHDKSIAIRKSTSDLFPGRDGYLEVILFDAEIRSIGKPKVLRPAG